MWAAAETLGLIREASVYKENLISVFVINRKIVNTAISRDVREALAESAALGQAVQETHPRSPATQEIDQMLDKLLSDKVERVKS